MNRSNVVNVAKGNEKIVIQTGGEKIYGRNMDNRIDGNGSLYLE